MLYLYTLCYVVGGRAARRGERGIYFCCADRGAAQSSLSARHDEVLCGVALSLFFPSRFSVLGTSVYTNLDPSTLQIANLFYYRSSCIDIDLFFFNLEGLLLSVIKAIVESMALWSLSPRV